MKRTTFTVFVLAGILAGLPATDAATFGNLGPYFSFTYGDGGGIPADVSNVTGQVTSPDGMNVKLFGDLGPIDGARFMSGFVIDWSGPVTGPMNPGDKFVADLDFTAQATGGTLSWSFFAFIWSNEGFESAQVLTDLMPMPASGQISGAHFESSTFTQHGDTGFFEGYVHVDWTGFGPADTFTMHIPQSSIDFTYVPVPEPGVCSLALTVSGILAARRLRPRKR